jgi:hypothetical protein
MSGASLQTRWKFALELTIMAVGLLCLTAALLARQAWWDRHFLPLFFFPHDKYVLGERLARLALGVIGVLLILVLRPVVGRIAHRMSGRAIAASALRILVAIALALAVTEAMMGHNFVYAAAETQPGEEPVRQPEPKLGWVFQAAHDGSSLAGGRRISYATDGHGYRVADRNHAVDLGAPSIVFTGESIIAGYGLNWEETIPAQVGAALKLQSANIAVFGYGNDQAYLRLAAELPRFHQPVAVVSLFIPSLFARNLGDDRPHLDARLNWLPATHRLWLSALFRFAVPYHSQAEIEQGIQAIRAELTATADLARRHGAIALVVDPQFGPETPIERMLRRRILQESGIEYVRIGLDPSWHLKGDLHPDPRATYVIAQAIAAKLKTGLETARQAGRQPLYGLGPNEAAN